MANLYSPQYDPLLVKGNISTSYRELSFPSSDGDLESLSSRPIEAGRDREEKKSVLSHRIHLGKFIIHIIALAATVGAVQLSFRNVYWFDSGGWSHWLSQDEVMNGLQFAAKLHEIFIMGSLTAMVMHFVRRKLFGGGLPFGLLTSGYQAGSVEYLFSKSMWATAWSNRANFLFVLLLALVIIFANMIGPSSAIAILPNLDWWPVTDPFNGLPMTTYLTQTPSELYPLHLEAPSNSVLEECSASNYSQHLVCPNGGFDELLSWADAYSYENAGANLSVSEPLGATSRLLISQNVTMSGNTVLKGDPGVAIATTLDQSILLMAGLFWNYAKSNPTGEINNIIRPMLTLSETPFNAAPLVQVQCNFYDYYDALMHTSTASEGVTFPTGELNNFIFDSYTINSTWEVDQSLYNFSRPTTITNFTWVDLTDYSKSALASQGASLGAFVTVPSTLNFMESNGSNAAQSSWILPCTIDARWAAVDISFDPNTNNLVQSNLTNPANFSLSDVLATFDHDNIPLQQSMWGLSDAIKIDTAWADILNVPGIQATSEGSEEFDTTMIQALLDQFITNSTFIGNSSYMSNGTFERYFQPPFSQANSSSQGSAVAVTVETILSMVLAEGLSRSTYSKADPIVLTNDDPKNITGDNLILQAGASFDERTLVNANATVLAEWTHYNFIVQRYGYGYGWRESQTVIFGLSILMIYIAVALIYIAYSLWFWGTRCCCRSRRSATKGGWVSSAWGEASEMLALALVTPAAGARDVLGNVGGGVEKGATWRKMVRVEEGSKGKLALVVDEYEMENGTGRGVIVGKKYR